eukprot:GFYU01006643.1.p1 GENE.GFYU01006643.1~~GFYU01006643.1.p1  ORF type:complete len:368 (+),score=56.98 GFYU01006643.1:169-1272(+)
MASDQQRLVKERSSSGLPVAQPAYPVDPETGRQMPPPSVVEQVPVADVANTIIIPEGVSWFWLAFTLIVLFGWMIFFFIVHPLAGVFYAMAIAPTFILAWALYYREHQYYVSQAVVLEMFWTGVLSAFPVFVLGSFLLNSVFRWNQNHDKIWLKVIEAALMAFVIAAFIEETFKYLSVRLRVSATRSTCWTRPVLEPYGVVICGFSAALGFATFENVLYVMQAGEYAFDVAIRRALMAVPGHVAWGGVHGANIARIIFYGERKNFFRQVAPAVLLHGFYDFFLFAGEIGSDINDDVGETTAIIGLLATICTWIFSMFYARNKVMAILKPESDPILQNAHNHHVVHVNGVPQHQGYGQPSYGAVNNHV